MPEVVALNIEMQNLEPTCCSLSKFASVKESVAEHDLHTYFHFINILTSTSNSAAVGQVGLLPLK